MRQSALWSTLVVKVLRLKVLRMYRARGPVTKGQEIGTPFWCIPDSLHADTVHVQDGESAAHLLRRPTSENLDHGRQRRRAQRKCSPFELSHADILGRILRQPAASILVAELVLGHNRV